MSREITEGFTQADANKSWEILDEAIDKIYEKKCPELSYEELYRNGYHLVLYRHGEATYNNIKGAIERNLKKYYDRLLQMNDDNFLQNMSQIWFDAKEMLKVISQIFLYMDKNYVAKHKLNPIKVLGYDSFRKVFLEDQAFRRKIQRELINHIRTERDGMMIDRTLIKNILQMLIELGVEAKYKKNNPTYTMGNYYQSQVNKYQINNTTVAYKQYFEDLFLQDTESYFNMESQQCINKMTVIEFLQKAEQRFQEEVDRLQYYLDQSTEKKLINIFIECFIIKNAKTIIEMEYSGLYYLFDQEKYNEINRMYQMFIQTEKSKSIFHQAFLDYQKRNLEKILSLQSSTRDPITITQELIEFHKKIQRIGDQLTQKQYERRKIISKIIKDAFEQSINVSSKVAFDLSVYIDNQFREGFKSFKDEEIEPELNDIINIFKYISAKDIFEKTYKTFLSKRLLHSKTTAEQSENLFVQKLRQECGSYFTAKIEVMFKDVQLSRILSQEFKTRFSNYIANQRAAGITKEQEGGVIAESSDSFDVKVLTMGKWPIQEITQAKIPDQLKQWTGLYEKFYLEKYKGRVLKWALWMGNADMRCVFKGKKKELLVSTYQAFILLLFNSRNSYTFQEIASTLMIQENELMSHLQPLVHFQVINLQSTDKNRSQNNNDIFQYANNDELIFNDEFTHKNYRVKIPIRKQKEKSNDSEQKTMEVITIERKYCIEACVVRIMKSRKKMEHQKLIEETLKLLTLYQFKPDISLIKTVIEELISKEYIDRSPDNKNIYIYLS